MWFLEKIRASHENGNLPSSSFLGLPPSQNLPDKARLGTATFPNVLTPDRIPEFCIPPRLTSCNPVKGPGSHQDHSPEDADHNSSDYSPYSSLPHHIQVESAEEIPALEEESTNSDPQSQAALSLPHFPRAPTSYGFCTLLESPHTRRKESIFHADPYGALPSLILSRSRANTFSGKGSTSNPIAISFTSVRLPPKHPSLHRQGACDSDTASSSDSSPFSSPLLSRSPPRSCSLIKTQSQEGFLCRALKAKNKSSMARNNSLSTEESSSTDNSPSVIRRASEGLLAMQSFSTSSPIFPLDLSCSRERLVGESTVVMDKGGMLRLSAEYCSENERLRIRLISAEGLYDDSVEPKNINCCITFSLVPGKTQKQRSTVIKRSRNPIFNEDFFFDGIAEEELYSLSVRMKAMNKGWSIKRDYTLGERELSLMSMLSV
ncbi:C2 calcium-dependent domain-containing protein 4C [Dryobates pubescens]|nr:C2 calcium-dependent domain-containing protein 4C [Dryobates pubescens]